jgi:hypothetical protein
VAGSEPGAGSVETFMAAMTASVAPRRSTTAVATSSSSIVCQSLRAMNNVQGSTSQGGSFGLCAASVADP